MSKILFLPLNQNHVLIFNSIAKVLNSKYVFLCHDRISEDEKYHTEALVRKYKLNYQHFQEKIEISPNQNLFLKILIFFKIKKQIRYLLKKISPNALVLALDNDPIAQSAIKESKRIGIKTIVVSEGLLKPYEFQREKTYFSDYFYYLLKKLGIFLSYIPYGSGDCDKLLVSGKTAFNILKNTGVDENKMVIVGQQKYDGFLKRLKEIKPVPDAPKKYLYAASIRIFNNNSELHLVKELISVIKQLECELIVKLHPRISNTPTELYELLNDYNESDFKIIKEGYDTFDVLFDIYAVITISSAIVLEALMMDKECIALNYLAGRRKFVYGNYDALYEVDKEDKLYEIIKESTLSKKRIENKKRLLEDEIYKLDGMASLRTVKYIEKMINSNS